jgi:hypothetical protein
VHFLLGNHEHAHIGGPIVAKFFDDEAARLEAILGPERAEKTRRWLAAWPLVATARRAGIVMLHGAPAAAIQSPEDVTGLDPTDIRSERQMRLLSGLLWARSASRRQAMEFLKALGPDLRVTVFGHDVVRAGVAVDREPMLCMSSSFGCHDGDKLYLDWDLAEPVATARELALRGLRPLYPDAAPVYRQPDATYLTTHDSTPPPPG